MSGPPRQLLSYRSENTLIEMPCDIIVMENIDGRLMVVLEDGRTVDMTDMFSGEVTQ